MEVVLASASPRRVELIKKISGLEVKVIPSSVDEDIDEKTPEILVQTLSHIKARAVFEHVGGKVIGADTVVVDGLKVLGKPTDSVYAERMLRSLCGKTHKVLTGVCLIKEDGTFITSVTTTFVTFKPYDKDVVSTYIATGSPLDKAGAYGIQDKELAPLVEKVEGDIDNVIGLPVTTIRNMIQSFFN